MAPLSMRPHRAIGRGLIASLPVVVGYVPVAISFGIAALAAGLAPLVVVLTSVLVYAGASQFVLIALLAAAAPLWVGVPAVLLMNARHLFYGPPVQAQLACAAPRRLPLTLWAFGLTDEVFATALGRLESVPAAEREFWYLGMQLGAYAAWVGGTILGVSLSTYLQDPPVFVREAFAFVLPALFMALLLEMRPRRQLRAVLASAVLAGLFSLVLPVHLALVLAMLAGALAGTRNPCRER